MATNMSIFINIISKSNLSQMLTQYLIFFFLAAICVVSLDDFVLLVCFLLDFVLLSHHN